MKKLLIPASMAMLLLVIGCSSTQTDSGGGTATKATSGQAARPPVSGNQADVNPLNDPNNILFKRSAYFDFNKYEIKPEYRSIIAAHAQYLREHPQAAVEIQGNCDERGSRKYNMALGLKRANAVRQVMTSMGIPGKQVTVVTFGKDKPDAKGHDEKSWALNRRSDIVYAGMNKVVGDAAFRKVGSVAKLALVNSPSGE